MLPSAATPIDSPLANLVYESHGLKKSYDGGQVQALRGVDLEIADGEFVAIVGPSGCGKTTLLQLLGALDSPSEGSLLYRGQPLTSDHDLAGYRARQIGFIFQSFHLLPTFTAEENVQLPMFESERPLSERAGRSAEMLNSVGLGHRARHFPAKLSGGERQRVAIARSLANDPRVLLADEPTGNLDSESAHGILDLLSALQRERAMTLVLVTHDMTVARRASRAIQMKDGRIIFQGDPAQLSLEK